MFVSLRWFRIWSRIFHISLLRLANWFLYWFFVYPVPLSGGDMTVTVTRNHLGKNFKIPLERWGFWQLCTTLHFCKKAIFDCVTNMLFLIKLRSGAKRQKTQWHSDCHIDKKSISKKIKIWLERWGYWQLCTIVDFCKRANFDCVTNMYFLTKLRPLFGRGQKGAVTVTRKYLNFGKTLTLGLNADERKVTEAGLGSKIGPIQPEIEKTHSWTFITDPAVS